LSKVHDNNEKKKGKRSVYESVANVTLEADLFAISASKISLEQRVEDHRALRVDQSRALGNASISGKKG
jgi:hypothetical protein